MKLYITLLFVFIYSLLIAKSYENFHFTKLTKDDGLSDNNVEVIFKDSDGFMWFGTRNGLCRFDGYEFQTYKKSAEGNSISGNRILDIVEDNNGSIWVGTYKNGLNRLNKRTGEITHYGIDEGIGERVNSLKKFKDGSIWVCSNRGLACYSVDNESFTFYHANEGDKNSLKMELVHDIIETQKGEIYVAPEFLGLQKFDRKTGQFTDIFYARENELLTNYRKTLLEDKNGVIWISAHSHGLCYYNPDNQLSEIFSTKNSGLSTNVLMGKMTLDINGNIWLCTEEDGINIFNIETREFSYLRKDDSHDNSLNTNHVYTIYIDNDNIMWIGTFDKGVNIYNPYIEKFTSSLFENDDLEILKGLSVLDVFEDSKKRVWIGTDGDGLFKFENNKAVKRYFNDKLLSSNIITSIGENTNGEILLGTYTGGLVSLNIEKNTSKKYYPIYNENNTLSSPNVWEIKKDSRNRIWLGLLGTGVDLFNSESGNFTSYGPFSQSSFKIDFPNVMVITEDSEGYIWFGTEGRGIYILDNRTNKVFQIPNDTIHKIATEGIIKCIAEDKWGYMWIGTEDNGLFKFNKTDKTLEKVIIDNLLESDPILSIEEDNNGNIWIGTNNGLYKYITGSERFNHFEISDGLSSNDFNFDAMVKLSDGRILAGTKNGADVIAPDFVRLNQVLPKVIFTKLTVLNEEVICNKEVNGRIILNNNISYTQSIDLTWKEKIFTLEFAAINYTLPEKCMYKYKLEGFDNKWVTTNSNRRFASYSNLAPGNYIFKVLASNNDGKWGNNETSIKIKVKPPFYRTLVFQVLMFVLVLVLVLVLYKIKINIHKNRFERQKREQERKIIELENEKLESELKKLAFNILNKNKLLIEQKNRIQSLSNKAKESVKEGLNKIVESIDADLSEEKDWKSIEPQIDKAYNQFILKLKNKHPDLTTTEIRIAAYIRMNMTTKEISEFMNKTQRAVENDRYRLRKKIGLESNNSIQNYFLNI